MSLSGRASDISGRGAEIIVATRGTGAEEADTEAEELFVFWRLDDVEGASYDEEMLQL